MRRPHLRIRGERKPRRKTAEENRDPSFQYPPFLSPLCVEALQILRGQSILRIDAQRVDKMFARFIKSVGLRANNSQSLVRLAIFGIQTNDLAEFLVSAAHPALAK